MSVLLILFILLPFSVFADVNEYITQPLTFEMPNSGVTAKFAVYYGGATSSTSTTKVTTNLQYRYSVNGGAWTDWKDLLVSGTTTYKQVSGKNETAPTLGGGSSPYKPWRVQFRGVNPNGFNQSSSYYFSFSLESAASTRNINIYGNVMSLIVGYDTDNEAEAQATLAAADEIPNEYCFYRLFYHISGKTSDACNLFCSNLIFPATKLKNHELY